VRRSDPVGGLSFSRNDVEGGRRTRDACCEVGTPGCCVGFSKMEVRPRWGQRADEELDKVPSVPHTLHFRHPTCVGLAPCQPRPCFQNSHPHEIQTSWFHQPPGRAVLSRSSFPVLCQGGGMTNRGFSHDQISSLRKAGPRARGESFDFGGNRQQKRCSPDW